MKRPEYDDDDDVMILTTRSKRDEEPRDPLAVSMGVVPRDMYDPSIMQWFTSVMPNINAMSKAKRKQYRTYIAVLDELNANGTRAPDDAMAERDVKSTLKNMLIFFPDNNENRKEIAIFSEYCNMNVRIGPSTLDNAGMGLFVAEGKSVGPNQRLTQYGGLRLQPHEPYNFDSVYRVEVMSDDHSQLFYRIDGAHSFRLEEAGRWANQSTTDPNARLEYDATTDELWLVSNRYIEQGDEIVWKYGENHSQSIEGKFAGFYI